MDSAPIIIYVEFLTITYFIKDILPILRKSSGVRRLGVFDTTISAFFLSQVFGRLYGFKVERINFQMADARDDRGACVYLQVRYHDLVSLQALILKEVPIQEELKSRDGDARLAAYLAKTSVSSYDFHGYAMHSELWHALVLIRMAQWHRKKSTAAPAMIYLYMFNRPFWKVLVRYAEGCGVIAHNMGVYRARGLAFKKIWSFCAKIKLRLVLSLLRYPGRLFFKKESLCDVPWNVSGPARMMVEHLGQFNIDRPECVSDLFFLDPQGIQGTDVCLVFNNRVDPIDQTKWHQMSDRGITAVARTVQSSLVDESKVPVFRHKFRSYSIDEFPEAWRAYIFEYRQARDYWNHFFRRYNIKLWTTWYKYDAVHMAMADAINDVGGISSVYQRAYESNPSPYYAVGSDLIFGFSAPSQDIHLKSGSDFKYHVTVGYIGDNRFKHLRPLAQEIRRRLLERGAERIIAYFDEISVDDGRWFMGHKILRKNYTFWLNRLLEDPKLGIIFKPKTPWNLLKRLGPVADLLRAAQRTGRCYVFHEGLFQGMFTPAAAAIAGDISIHDCLWAGTAGVDAALSGAKTLFLDLEGWSESPLYKLGPGVVFKDHLSLWNACQDHWKTLGGNPALGNWSSIINDIDPFRDGLAAQRLSEYLKELLEGLRSGMSAEDVMEQVAQRYAQRWGKDKIQRGRNYSSKELLASCRIMP